MMHCRTRAIGMTWNAYYRDKMNQPLGIRIASRRYRLHRYHRVAIPSFSKQFTRVVLIPVHRIDRLLAFLFLSFFNGDTIGRLKFVH